MSTETWNFPQDLQYNKGALMNSQSATLLQAAFFRTTLVGSSRLSRTQEKGISTAKCWI